MLRFILTLIFGLAATDSYALNFAYGEAKSIGITTCLSSIRKVTDSIIGDGPSGSHSQWNNSAPNLSGFSTMIERNYPSGDTLLVNATFAPTINGKCYIEVNKVYNLNQTCVSVAQEQADAKYLGELAEEVAAFEVGTQTVYFLSSGNRCTVVRKEIVIDGDADLKAQ